MRLRFILLGLVPGVVPALAGSADAKGANPFSAYAVLKSEPHARPGRVPRVAQRGGRDPGHALLGRDRRLPGRTGGRRRDPARRAGRRAGRGAHGARARRRAAARSRRAWTSSRRSTASSTCGSSPSRPAEMGLTEQPDFRQAMDAFRASTLRTTLQLQAAAGAKPDPAQVDALFKAAVKQWKVRSVMFDKEDGRQGLPRGGGQGRLVRQARPRRRWRRRRPRAASRVTCRRSRWSRSWPTPPTRSRRGR